jgi:pimeloyl-ACP methyl ester carboxylesterase
MAGRMVAAIPRARLVEIPGAYHHLTLDAPDALAVELAKYLAEID